jgi:hypothetical protein
MSSVASGKRITDPSGVESLYAERDMAIDFLRERPGPVTASDLVAFDRLGRARIAEELWARCDTSARNALLTDEHPQVRSVARLSAPRYLAAMI